MELVIDSRAKSPKEVGVALLASGIELKMKDSREFDLVFLYISKEEESVVGCIVCIVCPNSFGLKDS